MSDNDGILHWDERAQPALDVPDVEARLRARIAELEAELAMSRAANGELIAERLRGESAARIAELEADVAHRARQMAHDAARIVEIEAERGELIRLRNVAVDLHQREAGDLYKTRARIAALEAERDSYQTIANEIDTPTPQQSEDNMKTDRMLQFFEYKHLPPHLAEISSEFAELAAWMVDNLPMNAERMAGLRKLLEAKDCAVRAKLYKDDAEKPAP